MKLMWPVRSTQFQAPRDHCVHSRPAAAGADAAVEQPATRRRGAALNPERDMDEVIIRQAARADAAALCHLMQAYWAFEQIAGFEVLHAHARLDGFLSTHTLGRGW